MFGSLGPGELILIFVVALLLFGPRKLPELGRSIGKGLAEFKRASHELRSTLEDEVRAEEDRKLAPRTIAPPAVVPAADKPAETLTSSAETTEPSGGSSAA